ncbi:hypothetical protein [uncultured Microbacterium sp.]|uniref:hypothetical protein n=1 Tax=uncultured Microbacterium sp. TaxID=191216 RepID=UPI002613D3A8|nr:hypothetical protein [uncultured Microbacterium sp.]
MAVHVGEIHTELSGARGAVAETSGAAGDAASRYPGVREDEWRGIQARIVRLRRRVCAEDFDD